MPHQVNRGRKINNEFAPIFDVVHVGDDGGGQHLCESARFARMGADVAGCLIPGGARGASSRWPPSVAGRMARALRGSHYGTERLNLAPREFRV